MQNFFSVQRSHEVTGERKSVRAAGSWYNTNFTESALEINYLREQ